MFGECHAHIFMDSINYRKAVAIHENGVCDQVIRANFYEYQKRNIGFIRDGGDNLGVSRRAAALAEEYGIDYRTPIFAIHKTGHYGKIVGKGFSTMKEYHELVLEAAREGADFIKIMTTGLLDFKNHGKVTGLPLTLSEVREMVHIAHEEGFSVMSHTNGIYGVQAAIMAGVDSIEHGNYMDEETISMLADSNSIWVPTLVTIRNLIGNGRYGDEILKPIITMAEKNLKSAFKKGVKAAAGSDAGAYCVPHGSGIEEECRAFLEILGNTEEVREWLRSGEAEIRRRFRRW